MTPLIGWLENLPKELVLALVGLILLVSATTDAGGNSLMYAVAKDITSGKTISQWSGMVLWGLLVYLISITCFLILMIIAIRMNVPLGVAGAFWTVGVTLMTTIGGYLFFGQVPNTKQLIGIGLALVAIYLLSDLSEASSLGN